MEYPLEITGLYSRDSKRGHHMILQPDRGANYRIISLESFIQENKTLLEARYHLPTRFRTPSFLKV